MLTKKKITIKIKTKHANKWKKKCLSSNSYSDCRTGYYWINCSKTCPYPAFGHQCKQKCHCKQELCDFMNGCIESTCK